MWAAFATVFISLVWGATYLLGGTATSTAPHVGSRPSFKDCNREPGFGAEIRVATIESTR